MADINTLVEQLSGLTVLEIAELVKELETKWGVSAAAPVAVAAPAAGAARRAAAPAEEKTAFDVILKPRPARTRSPSSRKCARQSPASAWPKPRPSSKALPSPSWKASPRPKPTRSRRSSKRPAPRSKSSNQTRFPGGRRGASAAGRLDASVRSRQRSRALEAVFRPTADRHLTSAIVTASLRFHG